MKNFFQRDALKQEISILSKLDHPNLIRLFTTIQGTSRIHLITDFVPGRSLLQHIRKKQEKRIETEDECRMIFR